MIGLLFLALSVAHPVYRGYTASQLRRALTTVPSHGLADYDWSRFSRLQQAAIEYARCGPKGVKMWDDGGPWCIRWGWNGKRYR